MKLLLIAALALYAAAAGAASLSDPTRPWAPRAADTAEEAGFVLQSTLVSAGRKTAVIDGRRLRVGDRHRGAVVTAITPYEVRLRDGGRELRLRLLPRVKENEGAAE